MGRFFEQIPIEVMADGSIVFHLSNDDVTFDGRVEPAAALSLARQILELHEARELLRARKAAQ